MAYIFSRKMECLGTSLWVAVHHFGFICFSVVVIVSSRDIGISSQSSRSVSQLTKLSLDSEDCFCTDCRNVSRQKQSFFNQSIIFFNQGIIDYYHILSQRGAAELTIARKRKRGRVV